MNNRIYFDPGSHRRGSIFDIDDVVRSNEKKTYEVEDWIGRGCHAAVYRCKERGTGDEYAIKFLMTFQARTRPASSQSKPVRRFHREVQLLQRLSGNHLVKYHGTGRVDVRSGQASGHLFFVVMELADKNLREVMASEGVFDYEQYAGQFRGLASALASLHRVAVHRDIKPENILVAGERWLLGDYGLCTFVNEDEDDLTRQDKNVGPRYWLSPEAHNRRLGNGDEIGAASDVYQLAAVFWYVVTGRHPSGIVTAGDWTGPDELFHLLNRSLLHDQKRRPKNGKEFLTELEDALSP